MLASPGSNSEIGHKMANLIEIRDLIVKRDASTVLNMAEMTIRDGEVLAVIGPNGAGKSTFMLVLARLLTPESGTISFKGDFFKNLDELSYRRRISLVLQEPLLMDTSVFNNVALGLRFRGISDDVIARRVDTWLERLGISHLAKRPARKVSGGEAQRISLARALVLQPELLLLDEPFSALDAPTRIHLQEDLQAILKDTGITTVFITHDLDEALLLGERVAVLIDGKLKQLGTPDVVFNTPVDEQVAVFVGTETIIPGKIVQSSEGLAIVSHADHVLEAVSDLPVGREVYLCLRPEDVTIWPHEVAPVSSARNRLNGKINALYPQGALIRVAVDCGFPLTALITRASAREMGIQVGTWVDSSFKASAVHLIPR